MISTETVAKAMYEHPQEGDEFGSAWPPEHPQDVAWWLLMAEVALQTVAPEKDDRLVRYMAMATPLGYQSALTVVQEMTKLIDAETRAQGLAND